MNSDTQMQRLLGGEMRYWVLQVFVVAFGLAVSGAVEAQTWQVETVVMPNPDKKCPDVPVNFEVSVSGGVISLKNAVGKTFSGPVAADGAVSFQYNSLGGLGTIAVSGNALTRQLTAAAPRSLPGCIYALQPLKDAEVAELATWTATIQQVSGNVQNCAPGERGGVRVRGKELPLYGSGRPDITFAGIRLRDDGSADVDTEGGFGVRSRMRVKVAPGKGPRLVEYVTYANVCGYRMLPD